MHYIIVGNGPAGVEAALTIRERLGPEQARITLISAETDYFFSRTALMYALMNRLERQDMEPYERHVWTRRHIELRRARVTDLDAEAHTITLDDGESMTYDRLLLALGARPRTAPFDGLDAVTDGVVHFVSMQDLDDCERLAWTAERAVVVGGGLIGVELVESLRFHGLDVTFLVREPFYWPAALDAHEGELVTQHMRDHGVDVRHEEELASILTDDAGKVRGVTTSAGDEIACELLGICIGVVPNTGWLAEAKTPPELRRGLWVDRAFCTSLPDVWAAGDCCHIDDGTERGLVETIWYSAKRHGRLAAQSMLGDRVAYTPPVFFNSSKLFEIEYTTVGQVTDAPAGSRAVLMTHPRRPHVTARVVFDPESRAVIGFNMLGARWDHRLLARWVQERRDVDWALGHLKDAQFDVEFGRLPLDQMTRQEVAQR